MTTGVQKTQGNPESVASTPQPAIQQPQAFQPAAAPLAPIGQVFAGVERGVLDIAIGFVESVDQRMPQTGKDYARRADLIEWRAGHNRIDDPAIREGARVTAGLARFAAGEQRAAEADLARAQEARSHGDEAGAQRLEASARGHAETARTHMEEAMGKATGLRLINAYQAGNPPEIIGAAGATFDDWGLGNQGRAQLVAKDMQFVHDNRELLGSGAPGMNDAYTKVMAHAGALADSARRGEEFTAEMAQRFGQEFQQIAQPVLQLASSLRMAETALAGILQMQRDLLYKAQVGEALDELKKLFERIDKGEQVSAEEKAKALETVSYIQEADSEIEGMPVDARAGAGKILSRGIAALRSGKKTEAAAQRELARALARAKDPEQKDMLERASAWLSEGKLDAKDVGEMLGRTGDLRKLDSMVMGGRKQYGAEVAEIRALDKQAAALMKKADGLREKAKLEKSPAKRKELEAQAAGMESQARLLLRTADAKTKGLFEIAKFEKELREGGAPEPVIKAVRAAYRFYGTVSKWRADLTLGAAKFFLAHKDALKNAKASPVLGALVKFMGIISGPKKDSEIGPREKAESYVKEEIAPKTLLLDAKLTIESLEKAGAPKILVDGLRAAAKFFGTKDNWRGKTVLSAAKFFLANRTKLSSPQGKGVLGGLLDLVAKAVKGGMEEAEAPLALGRLAMDASQIPATATPVSAPVKKPEAPIVKPGAPIVKPAAPVTGPAQPAVAAPAVMKAPVPAEGGETRGVGGTGTRAKAQERAGILKGLGSGLLAFIEKEKTGGASEIWTNALSGFLGFVEAAGAGLEKPGAEADEESWKRISECTMYVKDAAAIIGGMPAEKADERKVRNDASALFGYAIDSYRTEGRNEKTLALDFLAREYISSDDQAYRARLLELGAGIAGGTVTLAQAKSEIAGRMAAEGSAAEAALRGADPQSADMFVSFMPKDIGAHPEGITLADLGKARTALDLAKTIIGKVLPAVKKEPGLKEPAFAIARRGFAGLSLGFADAAMEQVALSAAYVDKKYKKERSGIEALSANVEMGVKVSRVHALRMPTDSAPGMSLEDAAKIVAGEGGDAAALVSAYKKEWEGAIGDALARRDQAFAALGIGPQERDGYSKMLDEVHARVGYSNDPKAMESALLEIGGEGNFEALSRLYVMEYDGMDGGMASADARAITNTDAYFALGEGIEGMGKLKNPLPAPVRDSAKKGYDEMRAAVLRGDFIPQGWMGRIAVVNGAIFGSRGEEGISAKLAGIRDRKQRKDAETIYAAGIAELGSPSGRMETGLAMLEAGDTFSITADPADRAFILGMADELKKPGSPLSPADFTERAYIIAKKNRAIAEIEENDKIPKADKARVKADAAAYYDMAVYAHMHGRKQDAETIARMALLYGEALVQKYGGGDAKAADDTISWVHAQLGDMGGVPAKSRRLLDAGWMPELANLPGEYSRVVLLETESDEDALARSAKLRSETMSHSLALRRADTALRLAKAKLAPEAVLLEKKRLESKASAESDAAAADRAQAGEYLRRGDKYKPKAEEAEKRALEHDQRAFEYARQSDALDKDWFDKRVADAQAYAQTAYGQVGQLEQEAVALEAAGDLEGADAKMKEAARLEETILAPLVGLETYASSIVDIKTPWKQMGRIEARRGVDISLEVAAGHNVDETTGRAVDGALSPQRADELRALAKAEVAGGIRLVAEQRAKQRQRHAGHKRIETGRQRADIETQDVQTGAWGEVEAAGEEIRKAQSAGKDVSLAQETVADAAHAYDNGDYAQAYRLAYRARQQAQGLRSGEDVADEEMGDAHAAVGKARGAGKDMGEADRMLAKADEAYGNGDYAAAFKWASMARQYGEGVRNPAAKPMPQTVKDPEILPGNVSVTIVTEEEIGTSEDGSPMLGRVERTRSAFDRDRILHNYDRALDENDSYDFASSARFEKKAADQLTVGRVVLDVIERDKALIGRRRAELGAGEDGLVWVSKPDGTDGTASSSLYDPFNTDPENVAAFPAFEITDRDGAIVAYDPSRRMFSRDAYLGDLFNAADRIEAGDASAMGAVRATESTYSTDFDLENIWIGIGAPRFKAFQLRARAKPFTRGGLHITDRKRREEIGEGEARMNDARADTLADQPAAKWLVKGMGEVADRYEDAANDAQTAWLAYTDHSAYVKAQGTYGEELLAAISADLPPEVAAKIADMDAATAFEYLVQYNPGILIAALDRTETSGRGAADAQGRLDFGDYSLRAWAYDLKSRAKSTETGWVEGHAETFWAPAEHSLQNGYQEFAHNDMLRASSLGRWRRTGSGVSKLEIGRTGAGWYALANAIAADPMEFIRARDGTQTLKLEPTRVAYSNGDQWSTVGEFEGGYVVLPLLIAGLSFESAKHEAIITLGGTSLLEGSTVDWVHIFTAEGTRADEIRFTGEGHRGGIDEGGWGVEERAFYRSYEAARDSAYAVFGIRMYDKKERDAIARERFEGWYADVAGKRYADVLKGDSSGEFFSVYNAVADKFNSMPKPAFEAWYAEYSSENPDTVKGRDYRSILQLGNEVLIPIRYKGQIPRVREEVEMGSGADFKSGFGYMEGPGEAPIAVAVDMDAEALGAARALADQVRMDRDFMLGEALGVEAYRKSYWTTAKNWAADSASSLVGSVNAGTGAIGPKREGVATSGTMFGGMETLFGAHAEIARLFARGRMDERGVYDHVARARTQTSAGGYLAKQAEAGREQRGVIGAVNFVEDLAVGLVMPSTFAASGIEGFFDQIDASGGYGYMGTRKDEKSFWKGIGLDDKWARYFVYTEAWANVGIAVFGGVTGPLGQAGAFSRTTSKIMGWGMFGAGTALGVAQAGRMIDWDAMYQGEFRLAEGIGAWDFGVAALNVAMGPAQELALPHILRGFGVGRPAHNWMSSEATIRRELRPSLGRRMLFWVGGMHGENGIAEEAGRKRAREELRPYERAAFDSLEARGESRIPAAEATVMIETHANAREMLSKKFGEEAVSGYSPDDSANPINALAERARAKREEAAKAGRELKFEPEEQAALDFIESPITHEVLTRRARPAVAPAVPVRGPAPAAEAVTAPIPAAHAEISPGLGGYVDKAASGIPDGPGKVAAIRAAKAYIEGETAAIMGMGEADRPAAIARMNANAGFILERVSADPGHASAWIGFVKQNPELGRYSALAREARTASGQDVEFRPAETPTGEPRVARTLTKRFDRKPEIITLVANIPEGWLYAAGFEREGLRTLAATDPAKAMETINTVLKPHNLILVQNKGYFLAEVSHAIAPRGSETRTGFVIGEVHGNGDMFAGRDAMYSLPGTTVFLKGKKAYSAGGIPSADIPVLRERYAHESQHLLDHAAGVMAAYSRASAGRGMAAMPEFKAGLETTAVAREVGEMLFTMDGAQVGKYLDDALSSKRQPPEYKTAYERSVKALSTDESGNPDPEWRSRPPEVLRARMDRFIEKEYSRMVGLGYGSLYGRAAESAPAGATEAAAVEEVPVPAPAVDLRARAKAARDAGNGYEADILELKADLEDKALTGADLRKKADEIESRVWDKTGISPDERRGRNARFAAEAELLRSEADRREGKPARAIEPVSRSDAEGEAARLVAQAVKYEEQALRSRHGSPEYNDLMQKARGLRKDAARLELIYGMGQLEAAGAAAGPMATPAAVLDAGTAGDWIAARSGFEALIKKAVPSEHQAAALESLGFMMDRGLERIAKLPPDRRAQEAAGVIIAADYIVGRAADNPARAKAWFDYARMRAADDKSFYSLVDYALLAKRGLYLSGEGMGISAVGNAPEDAAVRTALGARFAKFYEQPPAGIILDALPERWLSEAGLDIGALTIGLQDPAKRAAAVESVNAMLAPHGLVLVDKGSGFVLAEATHMFTVHGQADTRGYVVTRVYGPEPVFEANVGGFFNRGTGEIFLNGPAGEEAARAGMGEGRIKTVYTHELQHFFDNVSGFSDAIRKKFGDDRARILDETTAIAREAVLSGPEEGGRIAGMYSHSFNPIYREAAARVRSAMAEGRLDNLLDLEYNAVLGLGFAEMYESGPVRVVSGEIRDGAPRRAAGAESYAVSADYARPADLGNLAERLLSGDDIVRANAASELDALGNDPAARRIIEMRDRLKARIAERESVGGPLLGKEREDFISYNADALAGEYAPMIARDRRDAGVKAEEPVALEGARGGALLGAESMPERYAGAAALKLDEPAELAHFARKVVLGDANALAQMEQLGKDAPEIAETVTLLTQEESFRRSAGLSDLMFMSFVEDPHGIGKQIVEETSDAIRSIIYAPAKAPAPSDAATAGAMPGVPTRKGFESPEVLTAKEGTPEAATIRREAPPPDTGTAPTVRKVEPAPIEPTLKGVEPARGEPPPAAPPLAGGNAAARPSPKMTRTISPDTFLLKDKAWQDEFIGRLHLTGRHEEAAYLGELAALRGGRWRAVEERYGLPEGRLAQIYIESGSLPEARAKIAGAMGIRLGDLFWVQNPAYADRAPETYRGFRSLADDGFLFGILVGGELPAAVGSMYPGGRITEVRFVNGLVGAYHLKIEVRDSSGRVTGTHSAFVKRQDLRPDRAGAEYSVRSGTPAPRVLAEDGGRALAYTMPDGTVSRYGVLVSLAEFEGPLSIAGRKMETRTVSAHSIAAIEDNPLLLDTLVSDPRVFWEELGFMSASSFATGLYDGHEGNVFAMRLELVGASDADLAALGYRRIRGAGGKAALKKIKADTPYDVRVDETGRITLFKMGRIDTDTGSVYLAKADGSGGFDLKAMEAKVGSQDMHRLFVTLTKMRNQYEEMKLMSYRKFELGASDAGTYRGAGWKVLKEDGRYFIETTDQKEADILAEAGFRLVESGGIRKIEIIAADAPRFRRTGWIVTEEGGRFFAEKMPAVKRAEPKFVSLTDLTAEAFGENGDGPFMRGARRWMAEFGDRPEYRAEIVRSFESHDGETAGMGIPMGPDAMNLLDERGIVYIGGAFNGEGSMPIMFRDGRTLMRAKYEAMDISRWPAEMQALFPQNVDVYIVPLKGLSPARAMEVAGTSGNFTWNGENFAVFASADMIPPDLLGAPVIKAANHDGTLRAGPGLRAMTGMPTADLGPAHVFGFLMGEGADGMDARWGRVRDNIDDAERAEATALLGGESEKKAFIDARMPPGQGGPAGLPTIGGGKPPTKATNPGRGPKGRNPRAPPAAQ